MQNVVYSLMAKTVKKSVRAVKSSAAAVVEEALPLYTPLRTILGGHQSSVTSPSGETLLTVEGDIVCVPSDFTE